MCKGNTVSTPTLEASVLSSAVAELQEEIWKHFHMAGRAGLPLSNKAFVWNRYVLKDLSSYCRSQRSPTCTAAKAKQLEKCLLIFACILPQMQKEIFLQVKTRAVQELNPTTASEEATARNYWETGWVKMLYSSRNTVRKSVFAHPDQPLTSPEILPSLRRERESPNLIFHQLWSGQ